MIHRASYVKFNLLKIWKKKNEDSLGCVCVC